MRWLVTRKSGVLAAGLCGILVAACSSTPSLESATGGVESRILIRDIVRRVKCEISDAFDTRVEDPKFHWLQNWTAKVDLTLQIDEQAGISPSVAYTKFFRNAFNFAAGSSSLTSNVIQSVQQSFTLSVGANLSEEAQRAETVTFSLSLKELKVWRKRLRTAAARSGTDEIICDPSGRELRGKLGLQEWIDAALYPVEGLELQAGQHPSPVGGSTRPPTPGTPPKGEKLSISVQNAIPQVKAARDAVAKSHDDAVASQAKVTEYASKVHTAMQTSVAPYFSVLTDELKKTISDLISNIDTANEYARQDVTSAEQALSKATDIVSQLEASSGQQDAGDLVTAAKQLVIDAANYAKHAKKQETIAAAIEQKFANYLPNPPIDGLLHSVQFVVTYGANVSPNWTLLQWKGPSLTVPGASAQGARTHTLNIALGPPAEQARLIQNQTVLNALHP
ncbi:MAG: hypothetical protein ACLPKB_01790 [Xanthobacteraceae bacterium]